MGPDSLAGVLRCLGREEHVAPPGWLTPCLLLYLHFLLVTAQLAPKGCLGTGLDARGAPSTGVLQRGKRARGEAMAGALLSAPGGEWCRGLGALPSSPSS